MQNKWNEEYYAVEEAIDCENLSIDWTTFKRAKDALQYAKTISKAYGQPLNLSREQRIDFQKKFKAYKETQKEKNVN